MWFLFALASAFFVAAYYALDKILLKKMNQHVLASSTFLITGFMFLTVSSAIGIPKLTTDFFYASILTSIFDMAATVLYLKALKETDISLAIPLLAFTPIFLIASSLIFLGEVPGALGIVGIFLIVIGAYFIVSEKKSGYLEPIKKIFKERGIFYMFLVSILYSFSATFSKIAVVNSDPYFAYVLIYIISGISFFIISFSGGKGVFHQTRANIKEIFAISIMLLMGGITINIALSQHLASYVIAINRSSILFSVIAGIIIFKEKCGMKRFLASITMFVGIVLISFS